MATARVRELLEADGFHVVDPEAEDPDCEEESGTLASDEGNGNRRKQRSSNGHHTQDGFVGDVLLLTHYVGVRRLGYGRWQDIRTGMVYREIPDALTMPDILHNDLWGSPYPGFPI